jgi:hypothetical protein
MECCHMSLLAHLFGDLSFFEVAMTVMALGVVERALLLLPETVVGENGWLLRVSSAEN